MKIKHILKSFIPEIVRNPIYLYESSLKKEVKNAIGSFSITSNDKWLDVGCGLRPYEQHFPIGSYVGVDVETSGRDHSLKAPDYFYDGRILPFESKSFDGVISTQVLEHVPNPSALLAEINRIVKPNGGLILSVPFAWQEHEAPFDFSRFSSFGLVFLLKEAGFETKQITKDIGSIESIAILLNVYIINNLIPKGFGSLVVVLLCFPIQAIARFAQLLLPDEGKFYLNLTICAKKYKDINL